MDWYTRLCLTAIAVLLTVLIVALWADRGPGDQFAWGQARERDGFGDSQAQRAAAIKEQQLTNAKLDDLIALFKSGQARVKVEQADAKATGGADVRSPKTKKVEE